MDAGETSQNPIEVQNMSRIVTLKGPDRHRNLNPRFSKSRLKTRLQAEFKSQCNAFVTLEQNHLRLAHTTSASQDHMRNMILYITIMLRVTLKFLWHVLVLLWTISSAKVCKTKNT